VLVRISLFPYNLFWSISYSTEFVSISSSYFLPSAKALIEKPLERWIMIVNFSHRGKNPAFKIDFTSKNY